MNGLTKTNLNKLTTVSAHKLLPRFKDFEANEEFNQISEMIGLWSAYLGYGISTKEIIFMNTFIQENFPNLNIFDLKECIRLVGIMELKTTFEGSFRPLYIGACLSEYTNRKREILFKQKSKELREQSLLPTPKPPKEELIYYAVENFKIAIEEALEWKYEDKGNIMYDLMTVHNLFSPTDKLMVDAEKYAVQKTKDDVKRNTIQSVIHEVAFKKFNKEYQTNLYKKSYIVTTWLRSLKKKEIKKIIQLITETTE